MTESNEGGKEMPTKKNTKLSPADLDASSAKPLQILLTNAAEPPFEGGLAKSYVMPQASDEYYEDSQALIRGTLFKSLDDDFEI